MKTQPAATAIRDELAAELAAAGITARVTIDPTDAAPALDSGTALAVVVNPPGLEWETTTISDPNLSADPLPALQATYTTDCED